MDRRQINLIAVSLVMYPLWSAQRAYALELADLSTAEANQGLKTALERGALSAVGLLGRPGGFLDNPKVRIPLPGFLEDAAKLLKAIGQKKRVEELEVAMNRAAEAAVPMAKSLLVNAVKSMTVTDAKNILTGGPTSVTSFFADKTREPLFVKFLPVVTDATRKVALAEKYNQLVSKVPGGLVRKEDATIEQYVTRKSLDGLYFMIGEEEKSIRQNPVATGSAVLSKVFGALR
jgi:autonomous glycyl radical cofactor GrcA